MISNYKKIGDYIQKVNQRNTDGLINLLLGVNLDKKFIPSVANINGVDFTKYKVVKKGQFGCKLMSVGRDKKLPISRLTKHNEAIISSAYFVFEVKDEKILLPEYLMMWFSREESDRYLWFQSGGDVRGRITWEDLCSLPIKVPSLKKQQEIVKEYNTVVNRIKLNEQLNQKLEETAQALYKYWFIDFEFPNEEGKPYKSSGGQMILNEELNNEIPDEWRSEKFTEALKIGGGGTPKTEVEEYWDGNIPFFTPKDVTSGFYTNKTEKKLTELGLKNCSSKLYPKNTIFITARGTVGAIGLATKNMAMNQSCYAFVEKNNHNFYGHQLSLNTIKKMKMEAVGAVFNALVTKDFQAKTVIKPTEIIIKNFNEKIRPIYENILILTKQNQNLTDLKDLFLAKMTKIEIEEEIVS